MGPVSLGINLVASAFPYGSGGTDYPILPRNVLLESEFGILLETGTDDLVITFGTFDSILLESEFFMLREDDGKLITQSN